MVKFCRKCKTEKILTDFAKDKYRGDGLTTRCKACRNKIYNEYYNKNPDFRKKRNLAKKDYRKKFYSDPTRQRKYRNLYLKRSFGITIDDYEEILTKQSGVCAICKKNNNLTKRTKHFCVDHCHKTKKVRGLLCNYCNRAIGLFFEDFKIISNAINYLKENK